MKTSVLFLCLLPSLSPVSSFTVLCLTKLVEPGSKQLTFSSQSYRRGCASGIIKKEVLRPRLSHTVFFSSPSAQEGTPKRKSVRQSVFYRAILFVVNIPVNLVAIFLAAVLSRVINHPSVRDALGACVVSGVKQLCEDPNLDDYVDKASTIINQDIVEDAREIGSELPKVLRSFVGGLINPSPKDNQEKAQE